MAVRTVAAVPPPLYKLYSQRIGKLRPAMRNLIAFAQTSSSNAEDNLDRISLNVVARKACVLAGKASIRVCSGRCQFCEQGFANVFGDSKHDSSCSAIIS